MRKLFAVSFFVLAACGGETPRAAAPSTTSETNPVEPTATAPAEPKATETKPADAPAEPPAAPAADISGQWCGKQVADVASCKGDEVGFLDIKTSGETVTGEFCERPKKDCMPLEASTFKGGTMAMSFKFKGGSGTGSFQLGADGVLSGDVIATKGKKETKMPKKFYRVK